MAIAVLAVLAATGSNERAGGTNPVHRLCPQSGCLVESKKKRMNPCEFILFLLSVGTIGLEPMTSAM